VESIDGESLIHLQVNAPRGELALEGAVVEFSIYKKEDR